MAKGKTSSKSNQEHYKNYRYEENRVKRLEKLAKEQPNNEQIQGALRNIHYRRRTPKARQWNSRTRELAEMNRICKRQYTEPKKQKLGWFEEASNG